MNAAQKILITGANGFVGQVLTRNSLERGYEVNCAVRKEMDNLPQNKHCAVFQMGDFTEKPQWKPALDNVNVVIHLAGRAHVMKDRSSNPLQDYRQANVVATLTLAQAAIEAGVQRFIYISTIKVNGEYTGDDIFSEEDKTIPVDPYALSKYEAEEQLKCLSKETGLEVVIIRPVLVYGPGVKGNLLRLLKLINKGLPLPFRYVDNKRSLLALDNLVDFILTCVEHPAAAGETFVLSDGEDISTERLVTLLADAVGIRPGLFKLPNGVHKLARRWSKTRTLFSRLYDSLQVDSSKARNLLDWQPPITLEEGLRSTAQWYLVNHG